MIKAVILDFDDTLCLTQKKLFEMQNLALTRMGREPMSYTVMTSTLGMILSESMKKRSPGVDFADFKRNYDQVISEYAEKGQLDIVSEENLAVLKQLQSDGMYIAIVTSRSAHEVRHLLEDGHLLSRHIKDIYHKDNTDFHKPDPRVFDKLLAKEGLKPGDCVYVGDSLGDAGAANAAGMRFIASLENGLKTEKDFFDYQVDVFISKFTELPEAIRTL